MREAFEQIRADLGDRRPSVWIPGAWDNAWQPKPGDRVQDARRGECNTSPEKTLPDGTRVPVRGVYDDVGANGYGCIRVDRDNGDVTRHMLGPTSQVEPTD